MTLAARAYPWSDWTRRIGPAETECRVIGDRPRLGIVVHDFALGGTERIAVRLANAWSSMGVAVDLFSGSPHGPLRDLLSKDVRVVTPAAPIERRRGSLARLGVAARKHFAQHPVDALFVPGNTHWPVINAIASIPDVRRPLIVAQVSAALVKPQRRGLRQSSFELRMRRKLRHADHVVTMCEDANAIAQRILRRTDIHAIPLPALEDDRCAPTPLPGGPPTILAASRLVPGKGIEALVAAFARLAHPTARLLIAGTGPQETDVRALIERYEIADRVEMLGYVPCIRPLLDRAHFLVMPSDHEGYGAVIIEALAAGRPVLATACTPAASELIGDPSAGIVVPIRQGAALADGLRAMIERSPTDPHRLVERVDRFRIGSVAREYLALMGIQPAPAGDWVRRTARIAADPSRVAALANVIGTH